MAQTQSVTQNPVEEKNPIDELTRVFNSAVVSSRKTQVREYSAELHALVQSPAFRSILSGIRQFARNEGISERLAAEQTIEAFRKIDRVWEDYLIQEGIDQLS